MMYEQKIFLNDKPLILTNSAEMYLKKHPECLGYLCLQGAFVRNFNVALKYIKRTWNAGAIIEDISVQDLTSTLQEVCPEIIAGGGVVCNENGELLMIFRRGKWDLPKGKLDDGEKIEACAIREVQEETGIKELQIIEKLQDTYHIFTRAGKNYLKTTHWYLMESKNNQTLQPQLEENIIAVKWVNPQELNWHLKMTYAAIKEVVNTALDKKRTIKRKNLSK